MHDLPASCSWRKALVLAAAGMLVGVASPARADLVVSVQSVMATAGTTGNALEVDLLNTGTGVEIASFSVELTVSSSSGITFTGANINTLNNTYIFSGNSAQGPAIATSPAGTTLDASDNAATGFTTLGTNSTLALGEVFFDVASSAPAGTTTVTLASYPATSLTDPSLGNVSIDTLSNGSVTIVPSAVPEAPSLVTATLGLICSALYLGTRRRTAN